MSKKQEQRIYSPNSGIRSPLALIKGMIADTGNAHNLALRLFKRDMKAQFRQSVLGYVWLFLPPLFTAAVWIFLNANGITKIETAVPYPVYVLIGTTVWQLFNELVNMPLGSVKRGMAIFSKLNVPKESVLITGLYKALFNFSIRLILLFVFLLFFGIPLGLHTILGLLSVFGLVLAGVASGILLVPVGMLYTDISRAIPMGIQVLFYLTPVVYEKFDVYPFNIISEYNPMTPLVTIPRDLITGQPITGLGTFLAVCGISLLISFFGWVMYRISMPIFVERVG